MNILHIAYLRLYFLCFQTVRNTSVIENQHTWSIIHRSRKVGRQWPCHYTIYGNKNAIHYLIWFSCRVTICLLFVSEVYLLIWIVLIPLLMFANLIFINKTKIFSFNYRKIFSKTNSIISLKIKVAEFTGMKNNYY